MRTADSRTSHVPAPSYSCPSLHPSTRLLQSSLPQTAERCDTYYGGLTSVNKTGTVLSTLYAKCCMYYMHQVRARGYIPCSTVVGSGTPSTLRSPPSTPFISPARLITAQFHLQLYVHGTPTLGESSRDKAQKGGEVWSGGATGERQGGTSQVS